MKSHNFSLFFFFFVFPWLKLSPPFMLSSHYHVVLYQTQHLGKRSANYSGGLVSKPLLCCANACSEITSPSITFSTCKDNLEGMEFWIVGLILPVVGVEQGNVAAFFAALPAVISCGFSTRLMALRRMLS